MKKAVAITVAAIFTACSMSVMADGDIGIVNMKTIFSTSPQVKSIKAELSKQFEPRKDQLEKTGKALQADIEKYQKNKDVMSKKDLATLESSITAQETAFRDAQSKFQQDVFAAQNASLAKFMDNVKTSVKTIAEKNKLNLVIPSNDVLYSNNDSDITKEVMDEMK